MRLRIASTQVQRPPQFSRKAQPLRGIHAIEHRHGSGQRRRNAMTASVSTPVVNLNDHATAAAYVIKHAGATALVVMGGQWPARPAGIITKADIAQAVAPARTRTMSGSATCPR